MLRSWAIRKAIWVNGAEIQGGRKVTEEWECLRKDFRLPELGDGHLICDRRGAETSVVTCRLGTWRLGSLALANQGLHSTLHDARSIKCAYLPFRVTVMCQSSLAPVVNSVSHGLLWV